MIVKIDMREKKLIDKLNILLSDSINKNIKLVIECLDIGDIIILNDNNEINIVIERKSISDLSSSIKDGRYEEQSFRLNKCEIHNHNIIYLIEGIIKKSSYINPNMVYSAMFSLNHYKGFSVIRSISLDETAEIILNLTRKINKNNSENKKKYYEYTSLIENNTNNNTNIIEDTNITIDEDNSNLDYCNVIKKSKKSQITKDNIGAIMLCQIPSISNNVAIEIMKQYITIGNLIKKIIENNNYLKEIEYINEKNQKKKLNKTNIINILKYLDCLNDTFISEDTIKKKKKENKINKIENLTLNIIS